MAEPDWAFPPGPGYVHRNQYTPDAVVWEHEDTGDKVVQTSRHAYHSGEVPPEAVDGPAAQSLHVAAQAVETAFAACLDAEDTRRQVTVEVETLAVLVDDVAYRAERRDMWIALATAWCVVVSIAEVVGFWLR